MEGKSGSVSASWKCLVCGVGEIEVDEIEAGERKSHRRRSRCRRVLVRVLMKRSLDRVSAVGWLTL